LWGLSELSINARSGLDNLKNLYAVIRVSDPMKGSPL
jgi:hypothetical protein